MFDVLSVSDMCVDLVLSGNIHPQFKQVEQLIESYSLEMGGSANIFASQFAKLGGKSGLVGYVGKDGFGSFLLEKLKESGVDTSLLKVHPQTKTGISAILAEPGDRAILTFLGTIDAVRPEDLPGDVLGNCRHWHIASYFLLNQLRHCWDNWLGRCRQAGMTLSLDTNWDPDDRWIGVREILPRLDVFLPNENEALAIAGENDVVTAGRKLSALGPLVAIKCGSQGAMVFKDGHFWKRPGEPVKSVVDAVGAGDNFDAGFLFAWLKGWEMEKALELGSRCAISSLGSAGGIAGQLRELL
jgi:ribokinase